MTAVSKNLFLIVGKHVIIRIVLNNVNTVIIVAMQQRHTVSRLLPEICVILMK